MRYICIVMLLYLIIMIEGQWHEQSKEASTKTFNLNALIEPIMPLSQDLFLTLNTNNRQEFIQNPVLQKQIAYNNITTIKDKTIPWILLLALTTMTAAFFLTRNHPVKPLGKIVNKSKKELEIEATKRLDLALTNDLIEQGFYRDYLLNLEDSIINYIETKYSTNYQTLTTEELLQQIDVIPEMEKQTSALLISFFSAVDQVKYSQSPLSSEQCLHWRALLLPIK